MRDIVVVYLLYVYLAGEPIHTSLRIDNRYGTVCCGRGILRTISYIPHLGTCINYVSLRNLYWGLPIDMNYV